MTISYGFGKAVDLPFDTAVEQVTHALKEEGFGILSDIDVAATLEKKLNVRIPPYRILGACNPSFANRAIAAEPSIGLLLPCNVVVRQDNGNRVHIEFMNPDSVLKLVDSPDIAVLANDVRQRLTHVMDSI